MAIDRCLPDLVSSGKITPDRAREVESLYGELEQVFRRQFGDQAAKAMASEATIRQLEIRAAQKRRQTLLQAAAQKGALSNMARYNSGSALNGGGPIDPRSALALFDRDSLAPYSNIEARRKAIKGQAHAHMDALLAAHRKKIFGGTRDPAGERAIVAELFGQQSGNQVARELADAWSSAAEYLRGRFNAAGGHIGKLERWGLPQAHDSRAVRQAGYRAWRDFVLPLLDRGRMVDQRTGAPFSDQALELALRDVHETIRTDGWSKIQAGAAGGGKMLANQKAEHRFLHFSDADSWLAYHDRFGSGTVFDAMMGHVEAMSRDISAMEILGPNPDATVRWLKDTLEKSGRLADDDGAAGDAAFAAAQKLQRLYDEYTGSLRRPESRAIALGFSAVRSMQTAAKLGSAFLSAVTDLGFQGVTRRFNGLSVARVIPQYVKLFAPGTMELRKSAIRRGLIAEEYSQMVAAQNRYLNEELTGEWAQRLAGGVLRLSGLARWTQAGRWAFGMEYLATLTENVGRRYGELPDRLRGQLGRYGIGEDGWDRIRATPLEVDRGADWLSIRNMDQADADRVLEMIHSEVDLAVPMASLRTRATMNSVAPRGTWVGETIRSAFLFKSFGISVVIEHGRRIMEQSAGNAARYAAGLFITTTLLGAVAMQLKELAKGKDPRPMNDENAAEFWGAAALQGGGFGIFGDFLGASENRFGGGLASTLAGPMAQTAQNVGDATIGNAAKAARGDKTDLGADSVRLLKQETPGGSLWYARLAFERLVADQLQREIDPNYRKSWRRMEDRADERGQEFFWEPGEVTPQRAPAF